MNGYVEYGASERISTKYLISKMPKNFVNEFVYDEEDQSKLERFTTYGTKANPPKSMTYSELSAAKDKDWSPIRDCKISWAEIPDYGRQPHTVSTRSQSTLSEHPDHKTDIEIRFFGYEFDEAKIPIQLMDKSRFTSGTINSDFMIAEIESLLEKDKRLAVDKK